MLMGYRKVEVSISSAGQRGRLNDHSGCGLDKVAKACEESSFSPAAKGAASELPVRNYWCIGCFFRPGW
jgi:hypothetical protein